MLLTVLLAAVVLRERVGPRSADALALGLAGTALVSFGIAPSGTMSDSFAGKLLFLLLFLAAVACGAAFTVWSGTPGTGTVWAFRPPPGSSSSPPSR
ncbi:hypothetical protein ACQP04_23915 [Pseudonocardia halophobica]|uniref:hypothetical protein n=1 Tax=Pseudonocardia halophobica TaxID=29401 RepID=UPI003D8D82D6